MTSFSPSNPTTSPGTVAAPRASAATVSTMASSLTATLLMIAFCGLVPLAVFATVPYPTDRAVPLEVALSLVILLISGVRLAMVIGAGRQNLFTFAFWLFAYAFIAVPAFAQVVTQRFPGTTPNIRVEYTAEALGVVLLGLGMAMIGGLMARRAKSLDHGEPVDRTRLEWSLDRNRITLLAIVGFIAWAYFVARIGPATFFSSRDEMASVRSLVFPDPVTSTIVASVATLPLLVCVHAMARYRRVQKATTGTARDFTLMLPVALLAVLFAINVVTSSRYLFGTMAFSLLVLFGGFATRRRARLSMGSLVFVLLAAFPLFAIFRRATANTTSQLGAAAFVNSGDYDSFAQIINSVNYVADEGVLWGKQLLGPFVFWVPRSVWPDKPIDTGVLLAQFRGYGFENLSAPFWSEAFLSGGWIGVIILFLVLGYVLKRADSRVDMSLQNAGAFGITTAILSFYMLILLRGSLLQATSTLAVIVVSILVVSTRRTEPRPTGVSRRSAARSPQEATKRRL
ncbi:O-antigen polymerase [Clavibacter michiganensis]|uniref:O-antigen polymerase n=1 Tax=Clavibacter michiganensis TaxID=28447 RepID=UPI0005BAF3C4|nr:O-antigen polymerase [Clavibacter michiganensis]